jgi:ribosomal subunit interface protein
MNNEVVKVTFRNMDHSAVIEEHTRKQLQKLDKFFEKERTPKSIHFIIEAHPLHAHHKIELLIKSPNYDLMAHDEGNDLNKLIEDVIDTMLVEMRKAKDKKVCATHVNCNKCKKSFE